MASFRQSSFSGGEISPYLHGRSDVERYAQSLARCRNMFITPYGAAMNRAGTKYVASVRDHTKKVELVAFVFSSDQTYALEFGNLYLRFFQNGGVVVVTGAAAYNGGTTYAEGMYVTFGGLTYRSKAAANTGNQPDISPTWWEQTSHYFITTPYLEADLPRLKFAQSGDVVTICHPSYAPRELRRIGHTSWTLSVLSVTRPPGPSLVTVSGGDLAGGPVNIPKEHSWAVTAFHPGFGFLDVGGESKGVEVTHADDIALYPGFDHAAVAWANLSGASYYNVYRGRNKVFGFVGSVPEPSVGVPSFRDDGADPDFSRQPPKETNPFDAAGKYPAAVCYFQQRRFFARTNSNPNAIWGTKLADFINFDTKYVIDEDDAVNFELASVRLEEIRCLVPMRRLIALTSESEWSVRGSGDGAISPFGIEAVAHSHAGTSWVDPLVIGNVLLFLQARGNVVRELQFTQEADTYGGVDLSMLARHLLEGYTIVRWCHAAMPHSVVWAVRSDGKLISLTYAREMSTIAWAWHDTDGEVESICSVPEGTEDAVYMVVKRTIGGATKRYVERLQTRRVTDARLGIFLDSALTFDGRNTTANNLVTAGSTYAAGDLVGVFHDNPPFFVPGDVGDEVVFDPEGLAGGPYTATITQYVAANWVNAVLNDDLPLAYQNQLVADWGIARDTLSGLSHLEGKTVSVLGDGYPMGPFVVAAGAITLETHVLIAHVGLPYVPELEPLDIASDRKEIRTRAKTVKGIAVEVESSRGLWVGESSSRLKEILQRTVAHSYGPIPLLTERTEVPIPTTSNNKAGRIFLRQVDPLPLTVLGITREVEFGDEP